LITRAILGEQYRSSSFFYVTNSFVMMLMTFMGLATCPRVSLFFFAKFSGTVVPYEILWAGFNDMRKCTV
jgi:hypothetical protein